MIRFRHGSHAPFSVINNVSAGRFRLHALYPAGPEASIPTEEGSDGQGAERTAGSKGPEEAAAVAAEAGFDVTAEELAQAEQELKKELPQAEEPVALDEKDLDQVAGGMFFFGDEAPDGHELGCFAFYYDTIDDYYFSNMVCACGSQNVVITRVDGSDYWHFECRNCGYRFVMYDSSTIFG
ncbi:MAG: hypothetical protein IKD88_01685 [Lachnospiraceae bacterium]|nr:hypothetical protein [Lachnospiraceae bacterium]